MNIEVELEEDGQWIAEVPNLPGVMAYGQNQKVAISKVEVLTLRVIAVGLNMERKSELPYHPPAHQPEGIGGQEESYRN